jgi:hypothetical protein
MVHDNVTDSMNTPHGLVAKTSPKMRSAFTATAVDPLPD